MSRTDPPRTANGTSPRRVAVLVTLPLVAALLLGGLARTVQPVSAQQTAAAAMLVTLSATGESLDAPSPGLIIRITLENATGADVGGLSLQAPVPAGTRVTESWRGSPGADPGEVDGRFVVWSNLSLEEGASLSTFAYRIVPEDDADGARILWDAAVRPSVEWAQPNPGRAAPPALPLNGLWGEEGLRRTVLPTLLTVFTRERPDSGTVTLIASIRAGSRDEDEATRGGSHWLEHAHFLGTTRRPDNQAIFGAITRLGGALNATTGVERTRYFNTVPAAEFDTGLDVLADQLLHSTFPRAAFEQERRVVFEELRTRIDTPSTRATDEFFRLVWQVSPVRQDAAGTIESVQRIPVETMLAYREQRYTTGNTAVAAVGNLEHDTAVAKIARAFAPMRQGPRSDRPRTPEPVQSATRRLDLGNGTRTAEIRLGWPVAGDLDDDWAALVVLSDILSFTGRRLQEQVRDRADLVLSIGAGYQPYSDTGALVVFATAQVSQVDRAVTAMLREVQRLHDGDISAEDVQASIRAITGTFAIADEANLAQATRFSDAEVTGRLLSQAEVLARVRQVTPAQVQQVAQRYLNPDAYTLVLVRP